MRCETVSSSGQWGRLLCGAPRAAPHHLNFTSLAHPHPTSTPTHPHPRAHPPPHNLTSSRSSSAWRPCCTAPQIWPSLSSRRTVRAQLSVLRARAGGRQAGRRVQPRESRRPTSRHGQPTANPPNPLPTYQMGPPRSCSIPPDPRPRGAAAPPTCPPVPAAGCCTGGSVGLGDARGAAQRAGHAGTAVARLAGRRLTGGAPTPRNPRSVAASAPLGWAHPCSRPSYRAKKEASSSSSPSLLPPPGPPPRLRCARRSHADCESVWGGGMGGWVGWLLKLRWCRQPGAGRCADGRHSARQAGQPRPHSPHPPTHLQQGEVRGGAFLHGTRVARPHPKQVTQRGQHRGAAGLQVEHHLHV